MSAFCLVLFLWKKSKKGKLHYISGTKCKFILIFIPQQEDLEIISWFKYLDDWSSINSETVKEIDRESEISTVFRWFGEFFDILFGGYIINSFWKNKVKNSSFWFLPRRRQRTSKNLPFCSTNFET